MASEFSHIVASASTGNTCLIVPRQAQATAYDVATDDGSFIAKDHTDSDQQTAMGGGVTVGSDEEQYGDAPSGLPAGDYYLEFYDSSDNRLGRVAWHYGIKEVNVTQVSGSTTAADNLETAGLAYSATRGLAGTALPAVAVGGNGSVATTDGSNYVAGVQGTINTLDGISASGGNAYDFAGMFDGTDSIMFRRVDGATDKTPYYSISAASLPKLYNFTSNALVQFGSYTSATWSNYVAALAAASDGVAVTPVYSDSADWASLPAGSYLIQIYDSATYNAAVVSSHLLYYDGANAWSEVAANILVDTGTTIPAVLGTPSGADLATDIAAVTSGTSYDKDDANTKRTWKFTKNSSSIRSPNIVTVHPDFDGTLKFDLSNQLNDGAGVLTITGVTVSPAGPTVTGPNGGANPTKTSDNRGVLFDIDGGQAAATDYTFTCEVATTDSDDALIVTGLMKSRAS